MTTPILELLRVVAVGFLLLTVPSQGNRSEEEEGRGDDRVAYILWGPSRVGKSTFSGELALPGEEAPRTGSNDGESTTEVCQVLATLLGLTIDTPGLGDSRLRFTNDESGHRVALALAQTPAEAVKFLVFESLQSDVTQLRQTVAQLIEVFGDNVTKHTVASKLEGVRWEELAPWTLQEDESNSLSWGDSIAGVVPWHKAEMGTPLMDRQLSTLQQQLAVVKATPTKELSDLRSRISERASEKCDAHPNQTKVVEIHVDEEFMEPYDFLEEYLEDFIDLESVDEEYDAVEVYQVNREVEHCFEVRRGGLSGMLGKTRMRCETKTITVPKTRPVTRTRTVQRPVAKTRSASRWVIKFRPATRTVRRAQTVQYRLPASYFYDEARREIVEEIRMSLRAVAS